MTETKINSVPETFRVKAEISSEKFTNALLRAAERTNIESEFSRFLDSLSESQIREFWENAAAKNLARFKFRDIDDFIRAIRRK